MPTVTRVPLGISRLRRRDVFIMSGLRHRLRNLAAGVERGEFALDNCHAMLADIRDQLSISRRLIASSTVPPGGPDASNDTADGTPEQRLLKQIGFSLRAFIDSRDAPQTGARQ
jgi:hypothetical protein